jgi:hypothetical protein
LLAYFWNLAITDLSSELNPGLPLLLCSSGHLFILLLPFILHVSNIIYSLEYNYAPSSFTGIWNKNIVIQGDRPSRNADNYTLPNPRTELFKKSPLYTLPLEWNNLDENRYIRN